MSIVFKDFDIISKRLIGTAYKGFTDEEKKFLCADWKRCARISKYYIVS